MAKKILTVDDSKTMREMVSYTLKSAGFDVMEAEDGKAALSVLAHHKFDVIITDLNMPNMNGFELIEQVRGATGNDTHSHKYTPILVLTTEADTVKKQCGKAMGATGWIVKPFNPEKLTEIVKKVCA